MSNSVLNSKPGENSMRKFDISSVGGLFVNGDNVYQCVGYCPHPTLVFQNLKTGKKEYWADCSQQIQGFKKLVVEGGLNIEQC